VRLLCRVFIRLEPGKRTIASEVDDCSDILFSFPLFSLFSEMTTQNMCQKMRRQDPDFRVGEFQSDKPQR
jgi:hypothetical protein